MTQMSISFVTKTNMTSLKHNNRDLTEAEFNEPAHEHIQRELSDENIYIKRGNLKETYDELFGEALDKYNAKQKRSDRRIADYFQHVKKSKTLDLQREIVVSVGTKDDWEKLSFDDKKEVAYKLEEYVLEFEQRHPNLHVYNAVIHMDEVGAPHAHFNLVPVAEGYKNGLERQPSFKKALQNEGYMEKGRGQLKEFRDKEIKQITTKLNEVNIERKLVGTNDIKDMHEYKQLFREAKELELQLKTRLVENFQAPEYLDQNSEFVSAEEYQDTYEKFKQLGFPEVEFTWRETTIQEKMDWVKIHHADRLASLENDIIVLNEMIREKYSEFYRIDSKTSESLSALEEAKGYINTLENNSEGLEAKIERLESRYIRLAKRNSDLEELSVMSENELNEIKSKKGLLGKEYVEMTKDQFENFKGLIYRSKNLAQHKQLELEQVKRQIPLRASKNLFEARLEEARGKSSENDITALKSEIRGLKNENSILRQQNNKMLGKLRELMPNKALKDFVSELKSIQPIVKIVKRVIEKGLEL